MVVPSTPYDVKGLLIQSIRDDDPVVFCEHKMLYDLKGEVPDEIYTIPLGVANYTREGEDVTIIALSAMVHKANGGGQTGQRGDLGRGGRPANHFAAG